MNENNQAIIVGEIDSIQNTNNQIIYVPAELAQADYYRQIAIREAQGLAAIRQYIKSNYL